MKEQIIKTIELLKERVKLNLTIIHDNERKVRTILEEPLSKYRSERLEEKYNENKKLLKENNDSIQLQLQLTKFIEAYREELSADHNNHYNYNMESERMEDESPSISRDEYFDLTINGEIRFNKKHPYFEDDDFFNDLLEYYKSIEDYETCGFLLDMKNKASR